MKIINGKITGGYNFRQFKGQTSSELLVPDLPEQLIVPLGVLSGNVKPLVHNGDNVKAGQIIWQDESSISSPIHSPSDGIVESIVKMDIMGSQHSAVKIATKAFTGWETVPGASSEWKTLTNTELQKVIYLSGTSSLGSGGIPTEFGSSVITPAEVEHIIVHATDAELYNPDLSIFLDNEGAEHFTEGLSILAKVMNKAKIHVAISNNTSTWFPVIDSAINDGLSVAFHKVKARYPQNHDSVLIKTVLGLDLPSGYTGVNKGVLILGIQDVCQIYEAVVMGKPLIERVVALGGPVFSERPHLKLKIGTLVTDAVKGKIKNSNNRLRFIKNSLLTGQTITADFPLEKDTEVLIALEEKEGQELMFFARPGFRKESISNTYAAKVLPLLKDLTTNLQGEHRACLSCGYCQDVCPIEILPDILFPYAERDRLDETAIQYGIFKCIDCNLCTYVCPSKIPIASYLKEGKKKLMEDGYINEDEFIRTYKLIGTKGEQNNAAEK
ncbi:MAG: 4Fe-4S dicluster domain-containing protein [Spirochaetaceae bacterium]|nr:4Fe-4S dicluster domain-containing protein [Spirochaetaceae bacterium]